MGSGHLIDTSFDVRADAGGGDPDSNSETLRRYHQQLWGKPLPSGAEFTLDRDLHHESALGEFWLSSDSIVHTYSEWTQPAGLVEAIRQVPVAEITAFYDLACTVGAYLVFPMQVQVDGRWRRSINQSRGFHPQIRDRFDLTLECIRRLYAGTSSPLGDALAWYRNFFDLFGDFHGYVDHFLLNDLVAGDYASVRFWTDFADFGDAPLPMRSVAQYREYMRRSMDFIRARNERIDAYASSALRDLA
jgi:hypothetical protein